MSELTLRVLLPLRPLNLPSSEWRSISLPFCLLEGGRVVRSGQASPEQWPAAQRGELILPSCDVTLVEVEAERLVGLPRAQWLQALPNMLEPVLLDAVEDLHFALSDKIHDHYRVAVLNRAWLAFLQGMVEPHGLAWIWYASHDGLALGHSAEWRFPTLEMEDGYVVSWRDLTGLGGGLRGRHDKMGPWPLMAGAPSPMMQEGLLPHFHASVEAFDIGPWAGSWRGGRLLWRAWRGAAMALLVLGLVSLLGPLLVWARLGWQYHDLQQQSQQQGQRLGWAADVPRAKLDQVPRLQDDFTRLAQDWVTLSAGQVNVTPVSWHYYDHRLEVRFGLGAQPDSLSVRAQQKGWRWQAQDKEHWRLEEKHP